MAISRSVALTPYPKHYVYIHFHPQHPDDINYVVYVGKGTDGRAWSRRERQKDHSHWMRDWQDLGFTPDQYVKVVFRGLTAKQALNLEAQLIKLHLKKGCILFNDTGKPKQTRRYRPFFPDVPKQRRAK
jgi:hypothetical protein